MKNLSVFVLAGVLLGLTGCSRITKMNKAELTVIPITDIKTNPAKWETIGKDLQAGKEFVFLIEKGQSIPVKLSFNAPFGKLNAGKNTLEFTRDMYLLISMTKIRISPDGQSWADIHDLPSIKELLGYDKGDLSIGFSASKEEGTQITIAVSAR